MLNLFEFDTVLELKLWMVSGLCPYAFGNDGFFCRIPPKYHRRQCPQSDAQILINYGKKPVRVRPLFYSFSLGADKISGYFLNIQPFSDLYNHAFYPAFLDEFPNFGIILRFNTQKELKWFTESHQDHFAGTMQSLKKSSHILKSAMNHGLIINYSFDDPYLPSQLYDALNHFSKLNPSGDFLVLVSFKDWSFPYLFSFSNKSVRDLFIIKIKGITHSPLNIFAISSINLISILLVKKGYVFKGSLVAALEIVWSCFLTESTFFGHSDV